VYATDGARRVEGIAGIERPWSRSQGCARIASSDDWFIATTPADP
jgi:hypothetical protein